jgi:hypothetical protein
MRGSRAKALRTPERPNPGRKGGGATKAEVRQTAFYEGLTRGMRRSSFFRNIVSKGRKNGKTVTDGRT